MIIMAATCAAAQEPSQAAVDRPELVEVQRLFYSGNYEAASALALKIRSAQGEPVLGPYNERRPMTSRLGECSIKRVQFRRRHTDVDRSAGGVQKIRAGFRQECFEAAAQIVVGEALTICPFVIHVVGRIGKSHVSGGSVHQGGDTAGLGRVTTQEPVWAEQPQIADSAHRDVTRLGNGVVILIVLVLSQKFSQLRIAEAGEGRIKTVLLECRQFLGEQFVIPSGIQREFVIGEDVGALLNFGEVIENDHRHLGQTRPQRPAQPGVSGQDAGPGLDQDGIGEPEFLNAPGKLVDLFVRMRSGVAVVRNQLFDRPEFDFGGDKSRHIVLVEGVKNFL